MLSGESPLTRVACVPTEIGFRLDAWDLLRRKVVVEIMAGLDGPLADLQGSLGGLEAAVGEIADCGNVLDGLLKGLLGKTGPKGLKLPF